MLYAMIRTAFLSILLLLASGQLSAQYLEGGATHQLSGYLREMGGVRLNNDFSDPQFDNLLHLRLNYRWNMNNRYSFVAEGRSRLFYNPMLSDYPFFGDMLDEDPGVMDLSRVWMNRGAWLGHSMVDRLYLDYTTEKWRFRVGRQRINWGVTMVSNPNDLFNSYSFFDLDYPERPGADAVRVQYHFGFASRIELGYAPARVARESTAALLYSLNHKGYDLQTVAGYYRNRLVLGMGWAGSIGGAGFKGEGSWFHDLEERPGVNRSNLVLSTGIDYMFGNGIFALFELLYNGGYGRAEEQLMMLTQPLRPDNIMFSKYAVTLSGDYTFTSLLQGGLSAMMLPDADAMIVMPRLTCSLLTDLDLEWMAQIVAGGEKGSLLAQAGSYWLLSLKYSY